jgi:hypothetical protein
VSDLEKRIEKLEKQQGQGDNPQFRILQPGEKAEEGAFVFTLRFDNASAEIASLAPKFCPKCNGDLFPGEDGNLTCMCGDWRARGTAQRDGKSSRNR